MSDRAILKGKTVVPVGDLIEWAKTFESSDRIVAKTKVGIATVSTVFLGLNHKFTKDGPDLWFETMVFGSVHDQHMNRYTTWDEAEVGHKKIVQMVEGA